MSAPRGTAALLAFLLFGTAYAAPSREELLKAEPEVRAATADLLGQLARGGTTRGEVAEAVRIMASQTASPAEEYLFLQGAFRLFVRAGEYARAGDVLRRMQRREFPVEALAALVGQALEPVPRGTDVGELEELFAALRDEVAQRRRLEAERRVAEDLVRIRPASFAVDAGDMFPAVVARVREVSRAAGGPGFRAVLRCPLAADGSETFPALVPARMAGEPLATILDRFGTMNGFDMRVRGNLRFLTRTTPFAPAVAGTDPFPGDQGAVARRLKRIRIGFVAFDGDETVDAAAERLLLAVADYGRRSEQVDFDMVLRAPPDGHFPRTGTARASDTTLYDAFDLLAAASGYQFEIRGSAVVLRPVPSAAR